MEEIRIKIASSEEEYSSIVELFESKQVATNDTITFLTDVTLEAPLIINKKCAIDLDHHKLIVENSNTITVKGGVDVTFTNGSIQVDDNISDAVVVQGSHTTLHLGNDLDIVSKNTAMHVRKKGVCCIEGAKLVSTGDQPTIVVEDAGSELTINSGNIYSAITSAVSIKASGVVKLYDGEIVSQGKDCHIVEIIDNDSEFHMEGGWLHSNEASAILSTCTSSDDKHVIKIDTINGKVETPGEIVDTIGDGDHGVTIIAEETSVDDITTPEIIETEKSIESEESAEVLCEPVIEVEEVDSLVAKASVATVSNESDTIADQFIDIVDDAEHVVSNCVEPAAHTFVRDFMVNPVCTKPSDISYGPVETATNQDIVELPASINVRQKIYLYRIPSLNAKMTEWKGVLMILKDVKYDAVGEVYRLVKFRVPGSGVSVTGYARVQDLVKCI